MLSQLLLYTHGVMQQISNKVVSCEKTTASVSSLHLSIIILWSNQEEPSNGILGNVVQSGQTDTLQSIMVPIVPNIVLYIYLFHES